ncbi:MAG TPA: hypothetical protein VHU91_03950 [Mycobacteriales bacterium]|nr:hypothetical protein [Mycobacteriales bacterium]
MAGHHLRVGLACVGGLITLALSGQVLGWLLIAGALSRLASRVGAALLVLRLVGAVLLGFVLLSQRPAPIQLAAVHW